MSAGGIEGMDGEDKWHLGDPPAERVRETSVLATPVINHPSEPDGPFLERPLYTLTVEHLAYFLIAALTVITRLLWLGARPLTPAEAAQAIADLAQNSGAANAVYSAPMRLLEAWLFDGLGINDYVARLGFALGGVLLVALAFALRRPLGRIGALALAALLALSPTMTYFSRASVSPIPALAMTLAVIALFFVIAKRATFLRLVAAAVVAGLALALDPTTYITAGIFAVATIVLVIWSTIFDDTYFERMRYWWVRHAIAAVFAIVIGLVVWLMLEGDSWRASGLGDIGGESILTAYRHGIDFYLPIFALYEFLLVILAVTGAALFIANQVPSRFAGWCFIWSLLSFAFYLHSPALHAELTTAMLLPMAILGAIAIEYLVERGAWQILIYPLTVVGALTLYVLVIVNFCFGTPDASEAVWARRALLYWSDPATTIQARTEATRLRRMLRRSEKGQGGGIFFDGDAPAMDWYLRDLPTTAEAPGAAAIVSAKKDGHEVASTPAGAQTTTFGLQDRWGPRFGDASPGKILKYFFTQRTWSAVKTDEATIILPPAVIAPGASATPAAPIAGVFSSSPTPTATATPTPSASPQPGAMEASPSPTSTESPAAIETSTSTPTTAASPSETATAIGTGSPTPAISATAVFETSTAAPTGIASAVASATVTSGASLASQTSEATPTVGVVEATAAETANPTETPQASIAPSPSATPEPASTR